MNNQINQGVQLRVLRLMCDSSAALHANSKSLDLGNSHLGKTGASINGFEEPLSSP